MFDKSPLLGSLNLSLYPDSEDFSINENIHSWLKFSNGRGYFTFDVSSLLLTIVLIFLIFNLKHLPGVWHVSISKQVSHLMETKSNTS
jgi:hypothetical protein